MTTDFVKKKIIINKKVIILKMWMRNKIIKILKVLLKYDRK